MKRIIGLFGILAVGVLLTTTTWKPKEANAISAQLTGIPKSIVADELLVTAVNVEVKGGWVNSDAIALSISIEGSNNTISNRGHKIVPLSSTTPYPDTRSQDLVEVRVDWDDAAPNVHADVYEVCVQVLAGGNPVGGNECGPFVVTEI